MILLGVEAATEVLRLTPFLHSPVPPRLPKVVDVWPVGLELSGSEDSLLQAEKALAHRPYVRGVVVEGRYRVWQRRRRRRRRKGCMKPATRVSKVCLLFSMQGKGHYSAIINMYVIYLACSQNRNSPDSWRFLVVGATHNFVVCHIRRVQPQTVASGMFFPTVPLEM